MPDEFSLERSWTDRAVAAFTAGKDRLFTHNGARLYADAEHATRYAALVADLDKEFEDADAGPAKAIQEAQAVIDREEHGDPADRLTDAELIRASARREFVKEDVAMLPLPELVVRIRQALASDDRAALYVWARYIGLRVEAINQEGFGSTGGATEANQRAHADLITLLNDARARFTDPKARDAAEARLDAARAFRADLRAKYDAATDAAAQRKAALMASGRYSL